MNYAQIASLILAFVLSATVIAATIRQGGDSGLNDLDLSGQAIPLSEVKADSITVVGAAWCAPCRQLKQIIPGLKDAGYRIKYVDIDDWKGQEVPALPTTFLFREDTPLGHKVGLWTVDWFKSKVIKPL